MDFSIEPVSGEADLEVLRTLLREYVEYLTAAGIQNFDYQRFEVELDGLPEPYSVLLLAWAGRQDSEQPAGCGLLKALENENGCEMKRLWVRPPFRGSGLGRKIAEALMEKARELGFNAMYLDTAPHAMPEAFRLYPDLGFTSVERYNDNPVLDVVFFRCDL